MNMLPEGGGGGGGSCELSPVNGDENINIVSGDSIIENRLKNHNWISYHC